MEIRQSEAKIAQIFNSEGGRKYRLGRELRETKRARAVSAELTVQ